MSIDAKLYRDAYAQLAEWNDAELKARADRDRQLTPAERWRQYESLWQLCVELAGPPSEQYLRQNYLGWVEYYLKMQQFELWKLRNAARTEETIT
jgi:hypothetical protein